MPYTWRRRNIESISRKGSCAACTLFNAVYEKVFAIPADMNPAALLRRSRSESVLRAMISSSQIYLKKPMKIDAAPSAPTIVGKTPVLTVASCSIVRDNNCCVNGRLI